MTLTEKASDTTGLTTDLTLLKPLSKNQSVLLKLFWGAFTVYSLAYAFTGTGDVNYVKIQAIQLLSLAVIIPSLFMLVNFQIKNAYLKILFIFYCLWLLFLVLSAIPELTNYSRLKKFLFNPLIGLVYFAPLVMLIPLNVKTLQTLFAVIMYFGCAYVILDVLFLKYLLAPNRTDKISQGVVEYFADLSFATGFLLFTYLYHTKKRLFVALVALTASLLFATIQARRGLIFMFSLMFLISYVLFTIYSKQKIVIFYFTILLGILGMFYITSSYKIKSSNLFGFLLDRGNEDTRTGVEIYFYDDFKTSDWLLGRGIFGTYFAPNIEENQETNYRELIETGYLHMILKGGLISLGLFLLISLPAIIKGLFYSKNLLSKAAAIWILMALLNSYPTIQATFNLNFLLIWVCIAICYSDEIRRMKESQLIEYLKPQKTNTT